jgi:hypothetical protein
MQTGAESTYIMMFFSTEPDSTRTLCSLVTSFDI